MPEILKAQMRVKAITDTETTVKSDNPKKNKTREKVRTITITDLDNSIVITGTPESLIGFTVGEIDVSFMTSQTTMQAFEGKEEPEQGDVDVVGQL